MIPQRINSLKFVFPGNCVKPNDGEIVKFAKQISLKETDIDALYTIQNETAIVVKFINSSLMLKKKEEWNGKSFDFKYDNGLLIQLQCEDASKEQKYVRLFNLIPEIDDIEVKLAMGKYGKVIRVIREKYPSKLGFNVYNGVRGIYMEMNKDIPQSLFIKGHGTRVYYDGIKEQCFKCGSYDHKKSECVKSVHDRLNKVITYSDVLSVGNHAESSLQTLPLSVDNNKESGTTQTEHTDNNVNNNSTKTDEIMTPENDDFPDLMDVDEELEMVGKSGENEGEIKVKRKSGQILILNIENPTALNTVLIGDKFKLKSAKVKNLKRLIKPNKNQQND